MPVPTLMCPHCTNDDAKSLEALDSAGVIWLCNVCARTFVHPRLAQPR